MKTKTKPTTKIEPEFWSIGDIAAYMRVSTSTINNFRNNPNEKFPATYWFFMRPRFKKADVLKWIETKKSRR